MEKRNIVPTDITRRRVIADLLGIPYILLGLGESLAHQPLFSSSEPSIPRVPKRETLLKQTLEEHQQALHLYFEGYYHRHGQAALNDITLATSQLRTLVSQGPAQYHLSGLLLISRYHQFGANVAREQQDYTLALSHADKAVEYAQEVHALKPNHDLMSVALCRRGLAGFEQWMTTTQQGNWSRENYSLESAVASIDAALSSSEHATPLTHGLVSLESGLIHAYAAHTEKERKDVKRRLEDGYRFVSHYRLEDDVNYLGHSPDSWYHLTSAEALIALGDYSDALGALEIAEEQTLLTSPRRFAYIDMLRAKAHLGLEEYEEAALIAKDALLASKAVKSEYNIARIAQIYQQLVERYKRSSDVSELGRELMKTHTHFLTN